MAADIKEEALFGRVCAGETARQIGGIDGEEVSPELLKTDGGP